ncbi:site-specific recombinase XerD [Terriglobus roseus DSM 18391]|uniref:Site-specific recombinase XerD n=2 Tax=Terriglobus roseus TaxID=392734 RepID=I3ZJD3_TERRK|nr:site-specific recombinase XerD [Terriglobus roseus DSM 18391]
MRLEQAISAYIEQKRAGGAAFAKGAQILRSFSRHVRNMDLQDISERQITNFLNGPQTSTVTWRSKHLLLKHFFLYWRARGEVAGLPLPPSRAPVPQVFTPYIYSRSEVRQLLQATRVSQRDKACKFDAGTFRAFLLFLYGTGALTGEARRLKRCDLDLRRRRVTIRGSQFGRFRVLPIGTDLYGILRTYINSRQRRGTSSEHFFSDVDGHALNETTLAKSFQRLRRIAQVVRRDGYPYAPRLHDFRHTFAVHRLSSWFKRKADINRMIPALSAYMGLVGLGSTERYLTMTSERFRTQLDKLSPKRSKKHWRDDAALMQFIEGL